MRTCIVWQSWEYGLVKYNGLNVKCSTVYIGFLFKQNCSLIYKIKNQSQETVMKGVLMFDLKKIVFSCEIFTNNIRNKNVLIF